MPNQKTKHDHAAIAHRATRKVCNLIITRRLILQWSRLTVHDCQRPRGVQVQREHRQQAAPKNPQHGTFRRERIQKLFQKFGVMIQFVRTEIHLQIADHVKQHEAHQRDTRNRHRIFLADCRRIYVDQKWAFLAG